MSQALRQARQWGTSAVLQLRSQPRLRLGIWLVAVILAVNGLLALGEARQARAPELQRLADQYARLEQILASADWSERAEAALDHRVRIENSLWQADSRGLARAEFETRLQRMADRHGLERVEIEIRPITDIDNMPGLVRLSAQLQARHDGASLTALLADLATAEPPLQVESLATGSLRPGRTRLDVQAVFRIGAQGPA